MRPIKQKNVGTTNKTKSSKARMTDIEMQKKSRASHKSIATKDWTEAESLFLPTRSATITDAVTRLAQLHNNLSNTFPKDLNQHIKQSSTATKTWKPAF